MADLQNIDGDDLSGITPSDIEPRPVTSKYDPLVVQELSRTALSLVLAATVLITVVWAFVRTGSPYWTNTKMLLDLLVPAETALVGAAVAFYFATKQ